MTALLRNQGLEVRVLPDALVSGQAKLIGPRCDPIRFVWRRFTRFASLVRGKRPPCARSTWVDRARLLGASPPGLAFLGSRLESCHAMPSRRVGRAQSGNAGAVWAPSSAARLLLHDPAPARSWQILTTFGLYDSLSLGAIPGESKPMANSLNLSLTDELCACATTLAGKARPAPTGGKSPFRPPLLPGQHTALRVRHATQGDLSLDRDPRQPRHSKSLG